MRDRVTALALAMLVGCATVPRGEPAWSFPDAFAATQVVAVHGERGEQVLLASVWRDGERFEFTFLDPALQVPVVTARLNGREFIEERFVDFPLSSADVEALLRDVAAIYTSRTIRAEGPGAAVKVGRWNVVLSAPGGERTCPFPGRILLRIEGGALPWIEVSTLDVRCGPR